MGGFPENKGNGPSCESDDQQHWERYKFAERIVVLGVHDETRVQDISPSIGICRADLYKSPLSGLVRSLPEGRQTVVHSSGVATRLSRAVVIGGQSAIAVPVVTAQKLAVDVGAKADVHFRVVQAPHGHPATARLVFAPRISLRKDLHEPDRSCVTFGVRVELGFRVCDCDQHLWINARLFAVYHEIARPLRCAGGVDMFACEHPGERITSQFQTTLRKCWRQHDHWSHRNWRRDKPRCSVCDHYTATEK